MSISLVVARKPEFQFHHQRGPSPANSVKGSTEDQASGLIVVQASPPEEIGQAFIGSISSGL